MNDRPTRVTSISTPATTRLHRVAPTLAFSILALAVCHAHGQTVPAPATAASAPLSTGAASGTSDGSTTLEAVVVTAQKRAEPSQSVPVSLTAISGRSLEAAGISGVGTLDQVAAGVTVGAQNPGNLNISIRGISNVGQVFQGGPSVGYYLDESPISAFSTTMPQVAFWDAERVEVLRGPQGTLFGEGSMGGTIRVITNKPESDAIYGRVLTGWSQVQGGSGGLSAQGMINLPLIKDELALRLTASHQKIIGWVDVPDIGAKDANSGKEDDARLALRWTPIKPLTVDLSYSYQKLDAQDFQATSPGVYRPRDEVPAAGAVTALSPRTSHYGLTNLTASYDLGPATLVGAITHFYQHSSFVNNEDPLGPLFFGGPSSVTANQPDLGVKVTTEELRLGSNGDERFNWTVGGYHKKDDRQDAPGGFTISVPAFGIANDQALNTLTSSNTASAVFANGQYKLTDAWAVQAGVRYYKADYTYTAVDDTSSAIFGTTAGTVHPSAGSAKATSPTAGLSWKPATDVLVFTKVSKGFRDGGSNVVNAAYPEITASYGPEKITAYELGIKTQPLRWLTVNASVYENRWTDLQLSFVTADGLFSYIANAGKAKATGGELEIAARPIAGLRLGVNLAVVNAKLDENVSNAVGAQIATSGNYLPFAPKFQASTSAAYSFPLTESLGGTFSANYSYRGNTYSEPANRQTERNAPYNDIYLKFAVAHSKGWGADVFVSNALNSEATNSRQRYITALPVVYSSYVQPRTFGVEVNVAF